MVVLQWYPEVKSAGNSTENTYSMLFCQPRVGTPSLSPSATHIICALDTSGSMMGNRLDMLQDTMTRLITVLEETGHAFWLSVITFNSTATILVPPGSMASTDHRRVLRRAISRLRAGGQTNMEDAFEAVNTVYDDAKQDYSTEHDSNQLSTVCLFMTDGYCTRGECMPRELVGMIRPDIALHSVGIGKDHDSHLLELLSYGSAYYSIPTANLIPDSVGQYMGEVCDVVHVGVSLDREFIGQQRIHHLCEPDRGFFQYVEHGSEHDSETEEEQSLIHKTFCIPQLSHGKPFVLVWKNLPNNEIERITSCVMDSSHHSTYSCYTTTPESWKAEDHIQTQAHLHRKLFLDMLAHVKTQDLSPSAALPHLETILTQWNTSMEQCEQMYPDVYNTHASMIETMMDIARTTLDVFTTESTVTNSMDTSINTPPVTPPRYYRGNMHNGGDTTPYLTAAIHSQNSMYGFTPHYTAFQDDPCVGGAGDQDMLSPGLPSNPPSLSRYVSANTQQYVSMMTPHR